MDFIKYLSEKHNINLNKQQQKAVINIEGPILLLAVPGGGKTTVIVSRCANMILNHKINPANILTITFSKASAMDMKHRFHKVFGVEMGSEAEKELHFSTIHSFCFNVVKTYLRKMRMEFPTIIEDEKAPVTKSQLLRQLYMRQNKSYISDDQLEQLSNAISYIKNMMLEERDILNYEIDISNFYEIYKNYEAFKQQNNYIDFDDMLTMTLTLFKENTQLLNTFRDKYLYINVDESQDTSYLQHQIIKYLAAPKNNIFMVGDEDQSIYTFRAAFPRALLDFKKTYPGARVLLMENNYRSTKNIVNAANKFIKQNKERYNKNMFSERDEGTQAKCTCLQDKKDQYEYIVSLFEGEKELSEIVVLYRNNISAIPIAEALYSSNIPFYLREAKNNFFGHWVTTDVIAFMELSLNPGNLDAFRQVYFKLNAYLSKAMVEYVNSKDTRNGNVFDILLEHQDISEKQSIRLMELKHQISSLAKMKANQMIDLIVGTIGYGEYLKKQGSDGSDTVDGLMQIISSLKSIAAKVESIQDFKNKLHQLQDVMSNAKFNKNKNAVTLSTIHSSKGLEFDKVYIIDLFDGQFPSGNSISEYKNGNKSIMEEEIRLFYVGATRAKKHLELITAATSDGKTVKPSRFIDQFLAIYKNQARIPVKTLHNIDITGYRVKDIMSERDLYIERLVFHKKFGIGRVRNINSKMDLLEIFFETSGQRIFSLNTCIDGNIIYAIEPK